MKTVSVFCPHTVPTEHPNAVRMVHIGRILSDMGYEVHLYGYDKEENLSFNYQGIKCHVWKNLRALRLTSRVGFENLMSDNVKKALREQPPAIIISVMENCKAQRTLIRYAHKNHVPMVQSVCEWFDRGNYVGLKGLLNLANNRYSLRAQYPAVGNIIAISDLLGNYYAERHCKTVVIPTIIDIHEYSAVATQKKQNDVILKIAYAGSPAKKDYIANAIRAVGLLDENERKRLQLHFYGPTIKQLSVLGISDEYLEKYSDNIICHGRIPYEQVKSRVAEADFTVLLRPDKRYANAGFPTKVGESMACGTPVIANLTSDLHKYVIDGQTGIVCADEIPESCADAFRRALALSDEQRKKMHDNCLAMAKRAFDYRAYIGVMEEFLKK